jgi:hypothetical protein
VYTKSDLLKVKVPIIFLGTVGFSPRRDGRDMCYTPGGAGIDAPNFLWRYRGLTCFGFEMRVLMYVLCNNRSCKYCILERQMCMHLLAAKSLIRQTSSTLGDAALYCLKSNMLIGLVESVFYSIMHVIPHSIIRDIYCTPCLCAKLIYARRIIRDIYYTRPAFVPNQYMQDRMFLKDP